MTTELEVMRLEIALGALIERHRGATGFSAEEARTWVVRGPVAFGTERLASTYWHRQVDILNAAWRHPRVAVRSANSMGKNFTAADLEVWWVFAVGGTVIHIANADRQLDIALKELRRALRGANLPAYDLFQRSLRVRGEPRLFAFTSNSADSMRGFHDPRGLLVVIDEGQGQAVDAVAYDAAFSCATGEGDKIFVLGNPAHTGGRFHAISKADNWCPLKIAASEHPNIAEGRIVIAGGPAPDWEEQIAAEYGRDSNFYCAFVEGEFPTEGTIDSLLRSDWVDAAFDLHEAREGLSSSPRPVAALDVARSYAGDESVCAIVQGARVDSLTAWRSRDLVDTASRFLTVADKAREDWYVVASLLPAALLKESPVTIPKLSLHIDSHGIGSGVVDELRRRGRGVVEHWSWNPARDTKRFANVRAEDFWDLRSLLELGKGALPRDPLLREDCLALQWTLNPKGKIQIGGKEELRQTLGRSTDRIDACVIGLSASSTKYAWQQTRVVWP